MHKNPFRRRARLLTAVLALALTNLVLVSTPADAAPTATRISGDDRFATAAAVSGASFAPGVPVAYVAVGDNFPDALTGGPAGAATGGPVLLTRAMSLPQTTTDELQRLNPGSIVILGGPAVVSRTVEAALAAYTDGEVVRIGGHDRYETAARVSATVFAAGASVVHIATGAGFADALAGGPAAGALGGPILLVAQAEVPADTLAELDRLRPDKIVILGGTNAVSTEVQTFLDRRYATVTRYSGLNRYLTAIAVSRGTFDPGVPSVYLATGTAFADALAGGPPAGMAPGPLLLTPADCLPAEVKAEIDRLDPADVIILGGTTAVSNAVQTMTTCFGDGYYAVGEDLPAGVYRTRQGATACDWERDDVAGDLIVGRTTAYPQIVEIAPTDGFFSSQACPTWTSDLSPLDGSATEPIGPGMYTVGTSGDMAPGTWMAVGGPDCYWARLAGFSGELPDWIEWGEAPDPVGVVVQAGDVGFESEGCGTWTKIS